MMGYDKKFYRNQRVNNLQSAKIIVPIVLDFIRGVSMDTIPSIIDLGCGSGNWLSVFKEQGCYVRGVDFGDIPIETLMIKQSEYVRHDLSQKYTDKRKYTLSMSLECAEHISRANAEAMVSTLMELSNIVLFSAAIPHQRGRGHINEQYQSYWIDFFDKRGYQVFDIIRSQVWNNNEVRGFYAQNMFLFVNRNCNEYSRLSCTLRDWPEIPFDIIHPEIWEQVNGYKFVKMMDRMHDNRIVSWIYYSFIKYSKRH